MDGNVLLLTSAPFKFIYWYNNKCDKHTQITMMMNGSSSLNRKQAMSPVNGQQLQSGSVATPVPGETSGGNSTGDGNQHHRHPPPPHHHQMHHMGPPPGGLLGPPQPGGNVPAGGGHLDSPGGEGGVVPGERRHNILPPCPLEKPPRGK